MNVMFILIVFVIFIIMVKCQDMDDHDSDTTHVHTSTGTNKDLISLRKTGSPSEAYLYGTISVLIVSLLSLAGVIIIPLIKRKSAYNSTMLIFMSLAVGTMASDAILHLIPEVLGLHGHEQRNETDSHDDHSHSNEESDKPYLGKMIAFLATLYGLYLLEIIPHIASRVFKAKRSVQDISATVHPNNGMKPPIMENGLSSNNASLEMKSFANGDAFNGGHGHGHSHDHGIPSALAGHTICGMKPVAFVVVVSDAMHNFADGLAIGAAFAKSLSAGLAVSVAVVCHELPHEVGDFAILLNTGMSLKKALILNFASALTCFAGLYPGIIAGQQEGLRQWVFAVVAAGFLYVALVHMLREIRDFGSLPWHLSIILQNVGLLLGFVVVLLLAIYEDKLTIDE